MTSLLTGLLKGINSFSRVYQSSPSLVRTIFYLRPLAPQTQLPSERLCLTPQSPLLTATCGFKVKYKLKKRCKDCYFVVRNERTYVICPTHPRHKQMSFVKKPKYVWKIAHACQSPVRPW